MALEFQTLKFSNDRVGLKEKDNAITRLSVEDWRIESESIVQGHMKGGQGCCLATICLPMGFLAGRTTGEIVVTLVRDARPGEKPLVPTQPAWGATVGRSCARLVRRLVNR